MVEAMGGRITVETAVGQGSTFTVRLPAVAAEDQPEPTEATAVADLDAPDFMRAAR